MSSSGATSYHQILPHYLESFLNGTITCTCVQVERIDDFFLTWQRPSVINKPRKKIRNFEYDSCVFSVEIMEIYCHVMSHLWQKFRENNVLTKELIWRKFSSDIFPHYCALWSFWKNSNLKNFREKIVTYQQHLIYLILRTYIILAKKICGISLYPHTI